MPSAIQLDWTRYWSISGYQPRIVSGYLSVTEFDFELFRLDQLKEKPCIVLLGEPGMGKSYEIRRFYFIQSEGNPSGSRYIDLNEFGDERRLVDDVFLNEEMRRWAASEDKLYLFFDSLDEALLNIRTIANILVQHFGRLPIERLGIRIACRTAEWTNLGNLEQTLIDLWGQENVSILNIAPLQRTDVLIASEARKLGSAFIDAVEKNVLNILAAKPVTLNLLLSLYEKDTKFPHSQSKVYEMGCLELCSELSSSRKSIGMPYRLEKGQRLVVAARIASLLIFANKSTLWMSDSLVGLTDSDLPISDTIGYTERNADGTEFVITDEEVREAISTGLFTAATESRMRFSHQTFAEFLAAWYLDYRNVCDEDVIDLLGRDYVHPQLQETSAWIGSRRPEIGRYLLKISPQTLLRSDVISSDPEFKAKLVDRLLEVFEKEEARDENYYPFYFKLNNPALESQLRPYLDNKSKPLLVRRVAIDIAEKCEVLGLQNLLADIVLDPDEERNTRINAAWAVTRIADSETKSRLKPLIHENDESLELVGRALSATWDENLTAEELFTVLTHPPESLYGSYSAFIDYDLIPKLKAKHLNPALLWIDKNLSLFGEVSSALQRLELEVLIKAWENLDCEGVFEKLVTILHKKIKNHVQLFPSLSLPSYNRDQKKRYEKVLSDPHKRRRLWLELLSIVDDSQIWTINHSEFLSIRGEDISWLAKQWDKCADEVLKGRLLGHLQLFLGYWGANPQNLEAIAQARIEYPEFGRASEAWFKAVELESDEAKAQKAIFEEQNHWKSKEKQDEEDYNKPITPSPKERVVEYLEKFENGDVSAWWQVNWYMIFPPNGRSIKGETEPNLTKLPVWDELDESIQSRLLDSAVKYLQLGDPANSEWLGTLTMYRPAFAGFRALLLLQLLRPAAIDELDAEIWDRWASIIYFYPLYSSESEEHTDIQSRFIELAYKVAPDQIAGLLRIELESTELLGGSPFIHRLRYCWDERLKSVLRERLYSKDSTSSVIRTTLNHLFDLNDQLAEDFACGLIQDDLPIEQEGNEILKYAIIELISHGRISCWKKIWKLFCNFEAFAMDTLEAGVHRFGSTSVISLDTADLAKLYVWLVIRYSYETDPVHTGAYSPGPRDELAQWRNLVLTTIITRGTEDAVSALRNCVAELPNLEWLKFTVLKAEENRRAANWSPLTPAGFLKAIFVGLPVLPTQTAETSIQFNELPISRTMAGLLSDFRRDPDQFVFFVGAGLSLDVFPSWSQLLDSMILFAFEDRKLSEEERNECRNLIETGDYGDVADICKNKMGEQSFFQFIRSTFETGSTDGKGLKAYKKLLELKPKILVTTNFDCVPELILNSVQSSSTAYKQIPTLYETYTNLNISDAIAAVNKGKSVIFKMHGTVLDAKSIVFTERDFNRLIHSNTALRQFLTSILTMKTVIFLGFSFKDPHVNSLLTFLAEIYKNSSQHYALLPDLSPLRRSHIEEKFSLKVITYDSSEGHPQVGEFLDLIRHSIEE